jgi:hypothetical protein
MAKQAARDRAARKEAKGHSDVNPFSAKADKSKSTAAKTAWREKQALTLYKLIGSLADKDIETDKAEVDNVELLISAAGVNKNKLYKAESPQIAYEMIVKAISAREL